MSDSRWDAAYVMMENGWSVIPVHDGNGKIKDKVPMVEWRDYQTEAARENQLDYWQDVYPNALIGAITGAVSGFVAVDCDNDDAIAYAQDQGVWSPVRVKTRRGLHLIFRHPRDGRRFGPRVGSNSTGYDWPKFPGLDFRGDGSYVVAFNAPGYSIQCDEGFDIFDLSEVPEWQGWPMDAAAGDVTQLDLTNSRVMSHYTEWERTAEFVGEAYPGSKIPTGAGNGRNDRVARYAGECVAEGIYGEKLNQRIMAFMDQFYMDRLDADEYKATLRSIEAAERRNHPERVAENEAKAKAAIPEEVPATPVAGLLRMREANAIATAVAAQPMLIEPFLPRGGIVHVSGYTGHGKSIIVSHILAAGSAGVKDIGPFEMPTPINVLYLDYENGRATLAKRLDSMVKTYGDPGDLMGIWTPWLYNDDMPLNDQAALKKLGDYIKYQKPDVVVIDTVRSAYPGLNENDADAWAPINRLMKRLQSYGIATIVLHHKNKPQSGGGMSREAGSTAQLNVVETQLYVTQVYRDKSRAEATAGLHDESVYAEPVWPKMEAKARAELGIDYIPMAVFEVKYGKVRDWTERHDSTQWLALCINISTGHEVMIGSSSTLQRARKMHAGGMRDIEVARTLGISLFTVREWLGIVL